MLTQMNEVLAIVQRIDEHQHRLETIAAQP